MPYTIYVSPECESCPHCALVARTTCTTQNIDTEYQQAKSCKCNFCPAWHQDSYLDELDL